MKKLFVAAFVLGLTFSSNAQKEEKVKELGLSFSNLDDFNMVYRFGTETSLWRFTFLNADFNFRPQESSSNESFSAGLGLRFGKEWRTAISSRFKLRYGADLMANLNTNTTNFDASSYAKGNAYRGGLMALFGFNYDIGSGLIFGAEIVPGMSYSVSESKRKVDEISPEEVSTNSQFNFNLDNSLELSLIYQF